mmetsp:Transcript_30848/g.99771  ORF Transcript_30848/g.99771 Transcript_30848/m.99771 type:complete len:258 (-) Transcript_30848:249-1022(-)
MPAARRPSKNRPSIWRIFWFETATSTSRSTATSLTTSHSALASSSTAHAAGDGQSPPGGTTHRAGRGKPAEAAGTLQPCPLRMRASDSPQSNELSISLGSPCRNRITGPAAPAATGGASSSSAAVMGESSRPATTSRTVRRTASTAVGPSRASPTPIASRARAITAAGTPVAAGGVAAKHARRRILRLTPGRTSPSCAGCNAKRVSCHADQSAAPGAPGSPAATLPSAASAAPNPHVLPVRDSAGAFSGGPAASARA